MNKLKILVTYFSRSGNTERVAKAIFDEISHPKEILPISDKLLLSEYDIIFLGFPIETYGPPKHLQEFLRTNTDHGNLALFITHGVPENQELLPSWIDKCKSFLPATAKIIDIFTCQGEVSDQMVRHLSKSPNPMLRQWAACCDQIIGQPDASRLQRAREFAKKILQNKN